MSKHLSSAILKYNPKIHKIYQTSHPVADKWKTLFQFLKIGLYQKYDAVLITNSNSRPRVAFNALFLRSKYYIGMETSSKFVNISLSKEIVYSVSSNNLLALKPLIPEIDIKKYSQSFELFFSNKEKEKALGFLKIISSFIRGLFGFLW